MQTDFNKLLNLIEAQKSVMLTTKQNDGFLKARPMWISQLDKDGTIWFFNNENSCKANEIKENPQVNLSFTNANNSEYVTYSGVAEIVTDESKIKELMNPVVETWFPEGVDHPSISLLKVTFEKGAYWISEESTLRKAFEVTKALLTGNQANIGEHESVQN